MMGKMGWWTEMEQARGASGQLIGGVACELASEDGDGRHGPSVARPQPPPFLLRSRLPRNDCSHY